MPIQLYWKFYHQKKNQIKKNWYFYISAQNIDCRGGSNEYPQYMFFSRNKKNNVYCKPQFYYTKSGI